jgi:hypothetical protein
MAARAQAAEKTLDVFKQLLPGLLKDLADIPDPRNPKKVKHKLTVVLLYGILSFVFHMSSRREAGREISRPVFYENLKSMFPELETLPHQDTLYRLLKKIDVDQIENAHIHLLQRLIRGKKFRNYLVRKRYLVAIDGTGKYTTTKRHSEQQLCRHIGKEKKPQYFMYVLEAKLVFPNQAVFPLISEFLDNTVDETTTKQDCEQKAFYRLTRRLKVLFPRLPITLLLDGLYANGPVMAECRKQKWQFMIVLKDDDLSSIWKEAEALFRLEPGHHYEQKWKDRNQHFQWANHIQYTYGPNDQSKQTVHLVICEETWEKKDSDGQYIIKKSRHAWLSSESLHESNVHRHCNEMARHRWDLENDILKEKHQGYKYEHIFAHDFHAMKGYHYLMHLAHLMNELVQLSIYLVDTVKETGIRGWIRFLRETLSGPWLKKVQIQQWRQQRSQLRFV